MAVLRYSGPGGRALLGQEFGGASIARTQKEGRFHYRLGRPKDTVCVACRAKAKGLAPDYTTTCAELERPGRTSRCSIEACL